MKLVLPANHGGVVTHRLDPARIIETAENLAQRIGQTLPGSSLYSLAVELAGIARATEQRARQASRPIFCTQMIGVISNLAALYTRGAAGDSVWRAASDVEMLTNAVTTKLLSKVETVRRTSTISRG